MCNSVHIIHNIYYLIITNQLSQYYYHMYIYNIYTLYASWYYHHITEILYIYTKFDRLMSLQYKRGSRNESHLNNSLMHN